MVKITEQLYQLTIMLRYSGLSNCHCHQYNVISTLLYFYSDNLTFDSTSEMVKRWPCHGALYKNINMP